MWKSVYIRIHEQNHPQQWHWHHPCLHALRGSPLLTCTRTAPGNILVPWIAHCLPRVGSCSFERGCPVAWWSCGCDGGGAVPLTILWTTTSAAPRMHLQSALRPASVQRCLAVSVGLCFACRVLRLFAASRAVPVEQLTAWFANSESPVQVDAGGTHALCPACRCHQ